MRSGSSEKDASGAPGVASTEAWRSRTPPRHGVDRKIAAQQVIGERGPEGHHGLAGLRIVGLGAVRGDLDLEAGLAHADRSEGAPDLPVVVRPFFYQCHGLIRRRVRGEV